MTVFELERPSLLFDHTEIPRLCWHCGHSEADHDVAAALQTMGFAALSAVIDTYPCSLGTCVKDPRYGFFAEGTSVETLPRNPECRNCGNIRGVHDIDGTMSRYIPCGPHVVCFGFQPIVRLHVTTKSGVQVIEVVDQIALHGALIYDPFWLDHRGRYAEYLS